MTPLSEQPQPSGRDTLTLPASPAFYLVFTVACVAAGLFLCLKVAFAFHHEPHPALFDSMGLTVSTGLVLFVGAVIGTLLALRSGDKVRAQKNAYQSVSATVEARKRLAVEMADDPKRARYAPLVARGEDWSDEHIAYYENPSMTVTCAHLRPIEQAMREAGIDVRLYKNRDVSAVCNIDFTLLKQTFGVLAPIEYTEFYMGDPNDQERPAAFLICSDHKTMIHTRHPDQTAPSFPDPNLHTSPSSSI